MMLNNGPGIARIRGQLAQMTRCQPRVVPLGPATTSSRYLFSSFAKGGQNQQQLRLIRSLAPRYIYSLSNSFGARRSLTNTSSGTYAPSNFATDGLHATSAKFELLNSNRASSGHLSILDGSDHLPSLPVPNLGQTLERLKETIWPITMNSAEFAQALELIEAFAGSAGQKLDLLLRAKASQSKNWLTQDWWVQEAYLKSRAPLPINSNPAMIYPKLPFEVNNQRKLISTMAQLVSGVIDFKLALLQGYNPEAHGSEDEFRLNVNQCYNQYKHIFGSTRMPGDPIDEIHFKPLNDDLPDDGTLTGAMSNKFNLILSLRGHFYEVQLNNIDHEQERIETLQNVFSKIIDHSSLAASGSETESSEGSVLPGIGLLTADRRDNWSQSIKLLEPESVRAIREAHLMVCLDTIPDPQGAEDSFLHALLGNSSNNNNAPESTLSQQQQVDDDCQIEALSRQILHSDRTNVGNRWFDKSLQLILVSDGSLQRLLGAGINYEHSIAEATVVTKLIEYSYDKTIQQKNHADQQLANGKQQHTSSSEHTGTSARYRRLDLVGPHHFDEVAGLLGRVRRDFVSQLDQFDLAYFNYKQYGSNSIKSWRFSPDSWFQVALQFAYYKLHKRLGPCYESASTRQFAYGRTETIRSLTNDVAEFCREPGFDSLKSAIDQHKAYANAANEASAIDRVLLGYRLVFNELKANKWAWGLPTFDECGNDDSSGGGSSVTPSVAAETNNNGNRRLRFNSLERADSKQQVDLNDLFTEKELAILSAFFNNELIERSKKFALSTSQVSSIHPNICMSYGPLLADGYGCCYNISGQKIVAAITANSFNQSFSCEVDKLSESLSDSLDKMRHIVEAQQQRSKNNLN
uniref:Carnitine O-acetyltransferase n=1 Tax=Aceria tosichella TaxID=561515 RepID=A0A6G1SE62_9ACAR